MSEVRVAMDAFFAAIQMKAYRQAELAVGNREDALDIVQEAMLKLAQSYSGQAEKLAAVVSTHIAKYDSRLVSAQKVRSVLFWFQREQREDDEGEKDEEFAIYSGHTSENENPQQKLQHAQVNAKVYAAMQQLPLRQQQAFVLRAWWDYDTRECAFAMNCSEGSVKTHYARALAKLRELLGAEEI